MGPFALSCLLFSICLAFAAALRPVDRHAVQYSALGPSGQSMQGGSFNSPFVGNGDLSASLSINTQTLRRHDTPPNGEQSLLLGKSDLWISDSKMYFSHMSAAKLSFDLPFGLYESTGTQDIGQAQMRWTTSWNPQQSNASQIGPSITGSTVIGENNVIITTLTCGPNASCPVDFNLGDTSKNHYQLESAAGVDIRNSAIWFRKENLHSATNPAYVGSCDPENYIMSVERSFVVDPKSRQFSFRNGSCLWIDDPSNLSTSQISTGPCNENQGRWKWIPNGTQDGDIAYVGDNSSPLTCLGYHQGNVGVSSSNCGANLWTFNVTNASTDVDGSGYLGWKQGSSTSFPTQCLIAIPDNTNNTLGVAAMLIDNTTNKPPPGIHFKPMTSPRYPSGLVNVSAGFKITLEAGKTYLLLAAAITLRDMGCAGTRTESSKCSTRPEMKAVQLVSKNADKSARAITLAERQKWWDAYWNASAIDLSLQNSSTSTNLSIIENFWYLQQYCLACTTRPGKVAPALIGNLVHSDPSAWNDQLTLDYNFEANFWGAGSSNHPEMYLPYIDVVTNPGLLATMRGRATNPGVWKPPPMQDSIASGWTVPVGHTTSRAIAVPKSANPDISGGKGFRGAAWTSTAFPLGDGRPDPSDYSTRFVGGLVATDLIQFYEYTQNKSVLETNIYPIVRDNAEFYMTYAQPDPHNPSLVYFPWSCGQEMCVCRNGGPGYGGYKDIHILPQRNMTKNCAAAVPNNLTAQGMWNCPGAFGDTGIAGEHNSHADIAFSSQSLRKALEYSAILGVDKDLRPGWQALLDKLPPYPTTKLEFLPGAIGEEVNGQTLLTEGLVGPTAEPLPWYNQSAPYFRGPIWPWCNSEYPITNFAAMWPTDEIGIVQTSKSDPALLKAAHDTVWAINQYTGYDFAGSKTPWANSNGFCLSWPPAIRVSSTEHAVDLVQKISFAISKRMTQNGLVSFRGGMLENMGATIAINDMLMQSHAKIIRLFPVWDAQKLGPVSFTTLRAYGAFLVSAEINSSGVISPFKIFSERGLSCQVSIPMSWQGIDVVDAESGKPIISTAAEGIVTFATNADTTYLLHKK